MRPAATTLALLALLLGSCERQPAAGASDAAAAAAPADAARPRITADAAPLPALSDRQPDKTEAAAAAAAIDGFGAAAYAQLRARPGNLAFSPASAALVLAMASAGAGGETLAEMRAALGHTLEPARQHAALGALERRWRGLEGKGLHVSSANRVFGLTTLPFAPGFLDWMTRAYDAPLERLSFADGAAAAARVNAWIESQTAGRIRGLARPEAFGDDTALVLANALYFRGRWAREFYREGTRPRSFWVGGTEEVRLPTMEEEETFGFARRASGSVVELDYVGGGFAMYLLVPRARDGLAALEAECLAPRLDACLGKLSPVYLRLRVPRFKIETDAIPLVPVLEALGMRRAFEPGRADFSAMAPAGLKIDLAEVVQKVYVAVDEEGTEAAAATVAYGVAGDAPPEPIRVDVDRPFAFVIRDEANGAVLFVGRVSDPR